MIAEKPALYNEKLAISTAQAMKRYLQYIGYFNAIVLPEDLIDKHTASVTYYVDPQNRFIIDSVMYYSSDSNILAQLHQIQDEAALKKGNPLDLSAFEAEKARISNHLRNNGYAYFYANYFDRILVDTTKGNHSANVTLRVLPPFDHPNHRKFRVGKVNVLINKNPSQDSIVTKVDSLDNIVISYFGKDTSISSSALNEVIYLKPGDLYSQAAINKTQKQLSALGIFRFVRIREEVDTISGDLINFRIELPTNFKMEAGLDFELNYTNRSGSSGTGNLFGFALQPTLKHRNLFGHAEQLLTNISTGVELNFAGDRLFNTVDIRLQSDLYLPRFYDYLYLWYGLNQVPLGKKRKLIRDDFYQILRENARTRISSSYNYIEIFQWYRYNLFNASLGYDLQLSNTERLLINHIGIDLLLPTTEPAF